MILKKIISIMHHRLARSCHHNMARAISLCKTIMSEFEVTLRHLAVIMQNNILLLKLLGKTRVQMARNPTSQVFIVDEDENMGLRCKGERVQ
jgi:hypothetical protein